MSLAVARDDRAVLDVHHCLVEACRDSIGYAEHLVGRHMAAQGQDEAVRVGAGPASAASTADRAHAGSHQNPRGHFLARAGIAVMPVRWTCDRGHGRARARVGIAPRVPEAEVDVPWRDVPERRRRSPIDQIGKPRHSASFIPFIERPRATTRATAPDGRASAECPPEARPSASAAPSGPAAGLGQGWETLSVRVGCRPPLMRPAGVSLARFARAVADVRAMTPPPGGRAGAKGRALIGVR